MNNEHAGDVGEAYVPSDIVVSPILLDGVRAVTFP
jgi:hypothetical protein